MNGISIIICTYNGKTKLSETLQNIVRLKRPCSTELIIVDNASTDGTSEYCKEFLSNQHQGLPWKIVYEIKPGLMNARIRGLRESQHEILLYCDDDNTLSEDYLEKGFQILNENEKIGALGGCGSPIFEAEPPKWFENYSQSFAVGPQANKDGKISQFPAEVYGAGIFIRKEPLLYFLNRNFKSVLLGRTANKLASGEDVEWCYLVQLRGYEIWYNHNLTFGHAISSSRLNWNYYLRLKVGIASGSCRLLPYNCLFKNPDSDSLYFVSQWINKAAFSTLVNLKCNLLNLFRSNKNPQEQQLVNAIWSAKMISYWSDFFIAYRHYKMLKSIL